MKFGNGIGSRNYDTKIQGCLLYTSSSEDLRFLKEVCADFALPATLFPDYSETLDGPSMEIYKKIPEGGTSLAALRAMPAARASIELGRTLRQKRTAASFLQERFSVPAKRIGLPIGINESDIFFAAMEKLSGHKTPEKYCLLYTSRCV